MKEIKLAWKEYGMEHIAIANQIKAAMIAS